MVVYRTGITPVAYRRGTSLNHAVTTWSIGTHASTVVLDKAGLGGLLQGWPDEP